MRIKRGVVSHRKHRRLLASVSGYRMTRRRLIRVAHEAQLHAGAYAYAGRKKKKSAFRRLWITRISQACREAGISYSDFIHKLKKAGISLDRKILADLVVSDQQAFSTILDRVRKI